MKQQKQINIFIEMVICLAVGCKSDILDKGRTKCLWISKGGKSEAQWLIKMKRRNIQSIQQARMNHAYCVSLSSGWKKMWFQLALNKTFCPTPHPFILRRLKQRQMTKINGTMLSAPSLPSSPSSSVFHTKFTISELKSK